MELTESQVELVSTYIRQNGVAQDGLHDDLLDHICTGIEHRIRQGDSFEDAFLHTVKLFGPGGLMQVQQDTFQILTEINETMKQVTFTFGLTSTILLLAGTIFKLFHWPGAGVMVTLGAVTLVLAYFPLLLRYKLKEAPKGEYLMHISGWVGISLTTLGVLFKVMHWPGASIQLLVGMAVLAFVYVPVYFFKQYRTSANRPITLSTSFVAITCLILVFALMKSGNSIWYDKGILSTHDQLADQLRATEQLNANLHKSQGNAMPELSARANGLVAYLDSVKWEMMAWATNTPPIEAANIPLFGLDNKHDMAIAHDMMLGADDKTAHPHFNASVLKLKLDSYRTYVQAQFPEAAQPIVNQSFGLKTEGQFADAQGNTIDWAHHQFGNTPLFTVLTNITAWQLEIRQMEQQLLLSKASQPEVSNPPS